MSTSSPAPTKCAHILPHKSRPCRMPTKPGATYCSIHLIETPPICPHCTTTLPNPRALHRHLRPASPLCPVLKRQAAIHVQPWHRPRCNLPSLRSDFTTLTTPDTHTVTTLVDRLLHDEHAIFQCPPVWVPDVSKRKPVLQENEQIAAVWGDVRNSTVKLERKHFGQIASLAAALLHEEPSAPCTVLELGAGRAYTSLYMAHVLHLREIPADVVVVDRAASRLKADRAIRAFVRDDGSSVHAFRRLRCDVSDLWLPGVEEVARCGDVRVVGKHVCGMALDLCLEAVHRFVVETAREEGSVRMVFASCCRRLCQWLACGGRAAVWKEWGVGEGCFAQICRMAHWGLDKAHSREMAEMGRKCRLLIDVARVKWLRRCGWEAYVGSYTMDSPESACIVAIWRASQWNNGQGERVRIKE